MNKYAALVELSWQGEAKYSNKTCPSATLCTKNPTQIALASNLSLCSNTQWLSIKLLLSNEQWLISSTLKFHRQNSYLPWRVGDCVFDPQFQTVNMDEKAWTF
jgi:hypothetical protein